MYIPQVLFAVFFCFELLCWSTWSIPLQPTSIQEWEEEMKNSGQLPYHIYLGFCLAAGSTGKNFFEHPESLSEDCVRTTSVAMDLLTKPSTYRTIGNTIVTKSLINAFEDKSPVTNAAELLCQKLNEAAETYNVSDFKDMKSKVALPKPEKNYFMQVPQHKNAMQFWQELNQTKFDDLQFMKLVMGLHFHRGPVSRAVFTLAEENAYKSAADALFIRVCDQFAEEALKKQITIFEKEKIKDLFNKKVDEYFQNDLTLKDEYKKLLEEEMKKEKLKDQKLDETTAAPA